MASLRQVRQRIRSIQSSKQIMRAMQMVSASKLKRTQGRLIQARDTMTFLDGVLQRVLVAERHPERSRGTAMPDLHHALCRRDADGPSLLVVFTSDAGLCGSYNTNLLQMAEAHLRRDAARATRLVFIGKKGHRYFTKRGYRAAHAYLNLAGRPNLAKAAEIGRQLMREFLSGSAGTVGVLYSRFASSSTYRPTVEAWLPVQTSDIRHQTSDSRHHATQIEYIFEPSPKRVFDDLLPRWALAKFQLAMLEAFTSEHSARMIAMKNATDNAQELLNSLTTQRNKIRQAAITKELSEIVGTAEALK